jgi:hypothetical protein
MEHRDHPVSTLYSPEAVAALRTYVLGSNAFLLSKPRPFPSFFRVHWRVLNVDGFHYTLMFEPVKYTWSYHESRNS